MTVRDRRGDWDALVARIRRLGRAKLTVGIHGEDTDRDDGDATNALVGTVHEFGLGVPRRSFLNDTIDQRRREVAAILTRAVRAVAAAPGARPLDRAAQEIAGLVQTRIAEGIEPALGAAALAERERRGGDSGEGVPLILSGQLRASILGKAKGG